MKRVDEKLARLHRRGILAAFLPSACASHGVPRMPHASEIHSGAVAAAAAARWKVETLRERERALPSCGGGTFGPWLADVRACLASHHPTSALLCSAPSRSASHSLHSGGISQCCSRTVVDGVSTLCYRRALLAWEKRQTANRTRIYCPASRRSKRSSSPTAPCPSPPPSSPLTTDEEPLPCDDTLSPDREEDDIRPSETSVASSLKARGRESTQRKRRYR